VNDLTKLGRFGLILADPPWAYSDLGHTRRIDRQYSVMTLDDICSLPVSAIAGKDAVLFLWVTATHLFPNGHRVMDAWGFEYRTNIVWDKLAIGMGHYARVRHEHLLIGIRGKPGTSAVHNLPSVIQERRGKHSVKPELSYQYIEKMFPDLTKIELFARRRRPGWASWGLELENLPQGTDMSDSAAAAEVLVPPEIDDSLARLDRALERN
jgi:N6-adenosine-specific RNA methylase IME4